VVYDISGLIPGSGDSVGDREMRSVIAKSADNAH
jgi:hypothetical protein